MFCGKCGKTIPDGAAVCPYCGGRGELTADDKTKVYETERTMIADGDFDGGKTMFADEEPAPQITEENQRIPDNFDYDEPSAQDFGEDEYYPLAVPNYDNQPPEDFSGDEQIPKAYRSSKAAAKKKSKSNAPLIVILVILILMLIASGGFLAWYFIHENSPETKLTKAEDAVIAGNYSEGLEYIKDSNDAQADAVRSFVEFLKTKDEYLSSIDTSKLYTASDGVVDKTNTLIGSFNSFDKSNSLPDKLKEKYDMFGSRLSVCTQATSKLGTNDLINAQKCIYDFAQRKRGESFSIADLRDTVSVSEPAITAIEQAVTGTEGYKELVSKSDTKAVKAVSTFFTTVSAQLAQDKFDLDNYSKSHDDNAEFTLTDKDENYKATVGDGFAEIDGTESMKQNADTVWNTLLAVWVSYSFE